MRKAAFSILKEMRKKYKYTQLDLKYEGMVLLKKGKLRPMKLTDEDIRNVEKRSQFLSHNKAQLIVQSINYHNEKKGIDERITIDDIYFPDEKSEYKKITKIELPKILKIFEKIQTAREKKENTEELMKLFDKQYDYLIEILKNCYYLTELEINYLLGEIFWKLGNLFLSTRHYEENLNFYIEEGEYEKVNIICRRIANFHHHINQHYKAVLLYEQLKNIFDKLEHRDSIKINLGICFTQMKNFKRALKILQEVEFYEEHALYMKYDTIMEIGICYIGLEMYDEAEKIYLEAEKNEDIQIVKWARTNRAELYMIKKDKKKLLEIYDDIEKYALLEPLDKNMETDYRYRIIKIMDFTRINAFLKRKDYIKKCLIKSMEIPIEEHDKTLVNQRERIIKIFLNYADKEDVILVNKLISYIIENKECFNLKKLFFTIAKFFTQNDFFVELKTFYKKIEYKLIEEENVFEI